MKTLAERLKISPEEAERRKKFLQFDDRDVELLRDLHNRLGAHRLDFIDEFYAHLSAFEQTRRFIEDPIILERLKRAQAKYFERLTAGDYGWDYILDRLRVGVAHQRAGLDPEWYLGGYRKYLCWLLPVIHRLYPEDPDRKIETFRALIKVSDSATRCYPQA